MPNNQCRMSRKNKILFIVPPVTLNLNRDNPEYARSFPIGLAYIAAVLQKDSYEVIVLDAVAEKYHQKSFLKDNAKLVQIGMTFAEIHDFVAKCQPDVVGISSMFSLQASNAYRIAAEVKSVNSNIPVLFGGAHATAAPEEVLKQRNVDFVVLGEGEDVILPLLNAIGTREDLNKLESIAFKDNRGTVVIKPKIRYVDVDNLPFPARHLFPMEKYFDIEKGHRIDKKASRLRSAAILISRGCPFHCNFCSAYQIFGKKYRPRQVENILEEIDFLVKTYRINGLYFSDDQFLANRDRTLELLNSIIARRYNLMLDAPNGISPWLLDEEIVQKMKEAGFWRVWLAIESGNQWILDNIIHKPVKVDKLPEIVRLLKKYELITKALLVVGNVGENGIESFTQMKDTFDLMRNLKINNAVVSFFTPHLGTEAFKISQAKGYLKDNTIDIEFSYNKPHLSTPSWSSKELEEFAIVERILCTRDHLLPFKLLRMFIRNFGGILLKERYRLIYNLYLIFNEWRYFYK